MITTELPGDPKVTTKLDIATYETVRLPSVVPIDPHRTAPIPKQTVYRAKSSQSPHDLITQAVQSFFSEHQCLPKVILLSAWQLLMLTVSSLSWGEYQVEVNGTQERIEVRHLAGLPVNEARCLTLSH